MSRSGDEMVLQLASLLGTDTVKTASKEEKGEEKEDKKEEKKEDKEEEKKEEKEEEKEEDKKKEKKADVMTGVLQDLVKLATELDEIGAEDAAGLVDDAIKTIVDGIETGE